ncbi:hypothetical protein N7466_009797 [Penicillium verhagenii]|uniref:uncharacterized protein n=1 Tax=Penicillium verhagenii TaxID=1562060 RepID=UPI002545B0E5|nr:uncharacterized protein N7466_009797 [Penicillium verhagenii]KAJ5921471.1 hypothetical protein N7466_009797 [Penicillium verhagenii]
MAQERGNVSGHLSRDGGSTLLHRSCNDCNRRKVRCNKLFPCDNCVRLGVECTFPPPGRKPRKAPRKSNRAELISRLSLLEQEVQKLGGQSNNEGVSADEEREPPQETYESVPRKSETPESPKVSSDALEGQFGRLVVDRSHGTSRYVNHQALTDLATQIKEVRDLFDSPASPTSSEEDALSPETPVSSLGYPEIQSPFIFGYHSVANSLRNYHPPPTISHLLFSVYEENVAPIIMIIHKSVRMELNRLTSTNPENLDKESEALVFSIYFAAISSLTPDECLSQLGANHTTLTKQYRFAVEQALVRAGFLHTRKLIVLQAAVLFLSCACSPKDAHFVWTMIAVIARLGLGLGLHRDSSHFGLGVFETEMRRRLWWYIYLLDIRLSDSQATSPQIREGDYDTRLPLNINDDDLSPDIVEAPQERVGFTEMTLTLVRCEILISHRKLMQISSFGVGGHNTLFQTRLSAIEEARRSLDERYLQFCDLQIPIHWVTATIARIAIARLWLVSHFSLMTADGFEPDLWPAQCDLLILTAIEVLEFVHLLETHENTSKWSWLFQGYVQWQSYAFVLSELCVRPSSPLSGRAWAAVDRVFEGWNGPAGNRLGLMMRPLERLRNRAAALRNLGTDQTRTDILETNAVNLDIPDAVMSSHIEEFPHDLDSGHAEFLDIFRDVVHNISM